MTTLAETMNTSNPLTNWEATRDDFENLPIGTIALAWSKGELVKVERIETTHVAFYSVNARKVDGRKGRVYIYGSSLVQVISRPEVAQ